MGLYLLLDDYPMLAIACIYYLYDLVAGFFGGSRDVLQRLAFSQRYLQAISRLKLLQRQLGLHKRHRAMLG